MVNIDVTSRKALVFSRYSTAKVPIYARGGHELVVEHGMRSDHQIQRQV